MKIIDENLGGTTPLDIIIKFKKDNSSTTQNSNANNEDDFEDEYNEDKHDPKYWFSKDKTDTITAVHEYLESLPEVGKVQSLATLLKVGKLLNQNKELDGVTLALLYNEVPDNYKNLITLATILSCSPFLSRINL